MLTVWKHLDRFHPETFSGGLPTEAESWIDRLEMLFESIGCDKYQKVIAAKTLLKGGALDWWNTVKPADGHQLDWSEFKRMFYDYYFPIEMRYQKEAEFFTLQQGEMDENTFIAQFMGLAKYVSQLNRTEEQHNNWLARQMFERCNDEVKARMGTYDVMTLEKLTAKIRDVCRRYKVAERSVRRDSHGRFSGRKEHNFQRERTRGRK
ncbi:hypothetical protein QN277_018781 [Acacia crassicarpa]|uniref:Retrotransposon gag domain-containing protein n=1 Tax=Acacia crassicarpa TaxID=499986 RepID=A0AAE1KJY5_9FABA|nr:hypothetical protein QN277_018781 [Acacia crassicarpa]